MKYKIDKTWAFIALFVGIYIVLTLVIKTFMPNISNYSTYNAGPFGTKALYLLTGELGYNAKRLEGGLRKGTDSQGELLVIFDHVTLNKQNYLGKELADWVRQGGNLLLLTNRESDVTSSLGITMNKDFFRGTANIRDSVFTRGVRSLNFDAGRYVSVKNHESEVIAGGANGTVALAFSFGQGRVMVVSDPGLVTNSRIQKGDQVILFLNFLRVIGPKTVWFDETGGLAFSQGQEDLQLSKRVIIAGVQLALAVLLLFVYWGRRFGRPVPLPAEEQGVTAEYVNTMANIFRQAKAREIALENIYTALWQRLTKAVGVPGNMKPAELFNLCRQRPDLDTEGLQRIIAAVEKDLQHRSVTEAELFALVHEMEIWRRENLKNAGS